MNPTQVSGTIWELICGKKINYLSFTENEKDVVGALNAKIIFGNINGRIIIFTFIYHESIIVELEQLDTLSTSNILQ